LFDSSVRTQLQDRAIASHATPGGEFIGRYEGLGPFMGIGLAVRRGAENPNQLPRKS
jgi:hypothetical protein